MTNVDSQRPSADSTPERPKLQPEFKDFFTAESTDLLPFAEAVRRAPYHKVNIAVHPYFLEEERYLTLPGVKAYNRVRSKYIFEAAQAGCPVIIFEEYTVIDDADDFTSKYNCLLSLPNVMFVRTMVADPTPYTADSIRLSTVYDKVGSRYPYNKPWTEEENNVLQLVADEFNLAMPSISISAKLSFDEYIDVRKFLSKADLIVSQRSFTTLGKRLHDLNVERIALGGTKYMPIVDDGSIQKGCVSFTAVKLHRLGFRVNISNYFVYPSKPTPQIQAEYRVSNSDSKV